jgi:hypothetical protein
MTVANQGNEECVFRFWLTIVQKLNATPLLNLVGIGHTQMLMLGVSLRAGLLRAPLSLGPAGRTASHPAHP